MDIEQYEDGALLSHKSVFRLPSNSGLEQVQNEQSILSDSINQWLLQVKSNSDEDYEFVRVCFYYTLFV